MTRPAQTTHRDHWTSLAEAEELSLLGQRLILRDLAEEGRLAWRAIRAWARGPSRIANGARPR